MNDIRTVADWLADGARSAVLSEDVLRELCERMVGCGIPLWRAAVFVNTLHPDVMGRRFIWHAQSGVSVSEAPFDIVKTDDFRDNPVAAVYANRKPIRRHIGDGSDDFPFLRELRADGITDYAAYPLIFGNDEVHVASWSTRQPGGFTEGQIAAIESIIAPLTRVAEIRALRRTAANLLETYIGHQTGERIVAGKIRRGYVETINAAIWLSDMRGFTSFSERLPPNVLIDLLNRYFECQVPPILDNGGEVLKFMGDGLLAIFPVKDGDAGRVARCALASAREAKARVDKLDMTSIIDETIELHCRLALHVGHVMYGNIGGGHRLDFTCIGPAVNLAARLEKLAGSLGRTIVASAEFAACVPGVFSPLGEFSVAGFTAKQKVFGLPDSNA